MRTYVFYTLLVVLSIGSFLLSICKPGSIDKATSEIVTFISILTAAVIACIFSVSKKVSSAEIVSDKKALYIVSNYWIRFFAVCTLCSALIIIGKMLEWPTLTIRSFTFDFIGFVALLALSLIFAMMFSDLPLAIRDILYIEEDLDEKQKEEVSIPSLADQRAGDTS